ncbi:hypothetical protein PVAP13_1KG294500 [Panicum virgatum]|uniref:Uncharacterized protein n=1 Tax=Panicum virgatum TaxID=38727 RepID=A0A8T0XH79_PANVG|nr:hypothetical protein PVAP13_1KG294500 [Panicum virgatum]
MAAPFKKMNTAEAAAAICIALILIMSCALSSSGEEEEVQTGFCRPDPDCETAGCKIQCSLPRIQFCQSDGQRMYCCCGDGDNSLLMVNSNSHQ